MTNETQTDKPVKTFNDGWLKVSIWKNEGEKGQFYTAIPTRTYKDKSTDKLVNGNSYTGAELLRLARLLTKAHDHIVRLRVKDKLDAKAADLEDPEEQGQL